MTSHYKNIIICLLLLSTGNAYGQGPDSSALVDGFYKYESSKEAKPVPLPEIKLNNVQFYKRVYKDIDLSDPVNSIFTTPGESLIEIILEGIREGKITAYDAVSTKENPTGDAFKRELTPGEAMGTLTDSVLVPVFDDDGNQIDAKMMQNDFNPTMITKFRVKEDIFYDKQRSRIETRIIGLAPLKKIEAAGEILNEQPVFWLYFPQCRYVFVTKEVSDPKRNIYNVNFDNIFIQQSFNSTIFKEATAGSDEAPNPEEIQREINQYKKETWEY